MATAPKTTINDLSGRQKVLEGLWLIGIEPSQLSVDPNQDGSAFLDALHKNGVDDNFVRRAMAGVDWRPAKNNEPTTQRVMDLLRSSGYRPDEIQRFYDTANNAGATSPEQLNQILSAQFNERTAGAVIYKATGGQDVKDAVWNPFRTDLPSKNAAVKYGSMGMLAGGGPDLPTPPSPTQIAQQAAKPAGPGGPVIPGPNQGVKGPGAGKGGGAGGGGAGVIAPAQRGAGDVDKYLNDNYGHLAYLLSIPEIAGMVKDAEKFGWDDSMIQGHLESSQWWQHTDKAMRLYNDQKMTDPATAGRERSKQVQNLRTSIAKYGFTVTDDRLNQLADTALSLGWTTAEADEAMSHEFHYQAGQSNALVGRLKELAGDNYVPLSDQAIQRWGESLIAGGGDESQFNQYVKDQAKSMFPTAAGAIDRGVSMKTFSDPYRQLASKYLEIDPDSIDFSDPKYLKALSTPDPKTGDNRLMSLSEWTDNIKKDDRYGWDKTENARSEATSLAQKITQAFGGGI